MIGRSRRLLVLIAGLAVTAACEAERAPDPLSVDADADGYAAYLDCDDADAAVHALLTAWPDGDGDGVGAEASSSLCTDGTVPAGFAPTGTDCAPSDALAWREITLVDRDGDGVTVTDPAPLCAGETLPEPWRAAANGKDCDDGDAARYRLVGVYADADGDGVGRTPRAFTCIGAAVPAGGSLLGYDVDDSNPSVTEDPDEETLARILE